MRIVNVPARQLRRAVALVEQCLVKHFYDGPTTVTSGRMTELD